MINLNLEIHIEASRFFGSFSLLVAGFQTYAGVNLWPHLQPRQSLQFMPEPGHAFDNNAIHIKLNTTKARHVPLLENGVVARLSDRKERLSASIASLAVNDAPWGKLGWQSGW